VTPLQAPLALGLRRPEQAWHASLQGLRQAGECAVRDGTHYDVDEVIVARRRGLVVPTFTVQSMELKLIVRDG
jgi:hypothetical protein